MKDELGFTPRRGLWVGLGLAGCAAVGRLLEQVTTTPEGFALGFACGAAVGMFLVLPSYVVEAARLTEALQHIRDIGNGPPAAATTRGTRKDHR